MHHAEGKKPGAKGCTLYGSYTQETFREHSTGKGWPSARRSGQGAGMPTKECEDIFQGEGTVLYFDLGGGGYVRDFVKIHKFKRVNFTACRQWKENH